MEATEILSAEHRVIEGFMNTLEIAARRVESGENIRPGFFLEAADFIKGFADGCHHKKEEGVLFTAMEEKGVPVEAGPLGVMLAEHEQGRVYTRRMVKAVNDLANGGLSARSELVEAVQGYINLLRQHIYKEDRVLFPMADQVIPLAEHADILTGFEKVEHEETGEGVHEKYLALAERLAAEMSR